MDDIMLFSPEDIPIIKHNRPERLTGVDMNCIVGGAGEYLVCHEIHKHGLFAAISTMPSRADVFIETQCEPLTVQVKTTLQPHTHNKTPTYQFAGSGCKSIIPGEFDIVACVALDISTVAYIPGHQAKASMSIGIPNTRRFTGGQGQGRASVFGCIDEYPLSKILESRGVKWTMI